MGSIGDIMQKIPGMGKLMGSDPSAMEGAEEEMKYIEAIILSMTPRERQRPKVINGSRRRRIAVGSGTSVQEVNRLLKDFEKTEENDEADDERRAAPRRRSGPRLPMSMLP